MEEIIRQAKKLCSLIDKYEQSEKKDTISNKKIESIKLSQKRKRCEQFSLIDINIGGK